MQGTGLAGVNVRDTGARGDKSQNDAPAIQAAFDQCAKAGGGVVVVPAGDYLCSTIRFRSNITLHLQAGATLYASTDPRDYELEDQEGRGVLLVADDVEGVTLEGAGSIHGQGTADLLRRRRSQVGFRTRLILFTGCRRVTIRNVTARYSDAWAVHLKRCEDVVIDGISVLNNVNRINSDGIDPDSCRNVRISNCHIVAGDDCIVFKSTTPYPCENIVVTNCTLESGSTAVKIGTESHGDFRDIHVSNCVIRRSSGGIGFFVKDGATVERVSFAHISIDDRENEAVPNQSSPILMDIERRHAHSRLGRIRDVAFTNIQISSRFPVLIQGTPESPIENLTLRDIGIRVEQDVDFSHRSKRVGGNRTTSDERDTLFARQPSYVTIAYVDGLVVDNLKVDISDEVYQQSPRSALSLHCVSDQVVQCIRRRPAEDSDCPVISKH